MKVKTEQSFSLQSVVFFILLIWNEHNKSDRQLNRGCSIRWQCLTISTDFFMNKVAYLAAIIINAIAQSEKKGSPVSLKRKKNVDVWTDSVLLSKRNIFAILTRPTHSQLIVVTSARLLEEWNGQMWIHPSLSWSRVFLSSLHQNVVSIHLILREQMNHLFSHQMVFKSVSMFRFWLPPVKLNPPPRNEKNGGGAWPPPPGFVLLIEEKLKERKGVFSFSCSLATKCEWFIRWILFSTKQANWCQLTSPVEWSLCWTVIQSNQRLCICGMGWRGCRSGHAHMLCWGTTHQV